MDDQLKKAVELLSREGCTFAAVNGDDTLTSRDRGVAPLLELLDSGRSLGGYSAADKVVGKAAAMLYVLLGVGMIHANVISRPALSVLEKNRIPVTYDTLTEAVRNRANTGFCPMEMAVRDTDDPNEGLVLIRKKLSEMKK